VPPIEERERPAVDELRIERQLVTVNALFA
jgi:hypothetical protein